MVSQAPSSPDPSEVYSMPLRPGTHAAGSTGTGGESWAGLSRVLGGIRSRLAEQSLAGSGTARAADAWSLLAVGHL